MRATALILILLFSVSASADDRKRNVVGKLDLSGKPQVRVMSSHERKVAAQNTLALNLDVSPDQIVCKTVSAGRDTASKLKVRRCKTRAQFRAELEEQSTELGRGLDRASIAQAQGRLRSSGLRRVRVSTK